MILTHIVGIVVWTGILKGLHHTARLFQSVHLEVPVLIEQRVMLAFQNQLFLILGGGKFEQFSGHHIHIFDEQDGAFSALLEAVKPGIQEII